MNELTKYRNDMNDVSFATFTHKDNNIFFAIVSRMRDKGTQSITFSYKYLMKISGLHYGNRLSQFTRALDNTYSKMLTLGIHYNNSEHEGRWVLFNGFDIDKKKHTVTITVNPRLKGVLNSLKANFTRFSLEQFTSIYSPYAQTLFRLIKQYRQVGHLHLPMKILRMKLGVPKSYDAYLINKNVISTIAIELTPYIKGLEIVVRHHGRGNKVVGYDFYWSPERPKQDYFSKGHKRDFLQKVKYVKLNDSLSPKLKRKSLEYIGYDKYMGLDTDLNKRPKQEPMKTFNHWLKISPLGNIESILYLRKKHSPFVNLSEYQARKARRRVKQLKTKRAKEIKPLKIKATKDVECQLKFEHKSATKQQFELMYKRFLNKELKWHEFLKKH